ncbi:sigma 54-interacting transcriptional regulator [Crassaminicella profunda]|uniref:sigma 54-interacting transcriptional regulator n=1 Tax=Crassaminicella profunda TaxID=1286698 RepID=UPI001CA701D9|nr:sigma 54-interacting transcriptional regulator [Crassaminicella profunda]QZY55298.1 sigma 54-interacting transcriptional regulator [Crassaminicella profunda]
MEKYFYPLINNIVDALVAIDKDGNVLVMNQRAEKLLDLKKEHMIGKHIHNIIPHCRLPIIVKTGEEERNRYICINKRQYKISMMPMVLDGKIEGAMALFHDITNYKKMSKEMDQDKVYIEILNTILDTANEWVTVVDEEGIITMMSKAYKEFLNISDPEGRHVAQVIENTRLHVVLETGVMEIGEIQEIKNKRMISMRMPIKKNGKIIGAVGKVMFKDIRDFQMLGKKISKLEKELAYYKSELDKERTAKYSFQDLVGDSDNMGLVKDMAMKVAKTSSNILITGESGTGKELFAHSIHNASNRYLGPFVKINCAAIPAELLESELFGYEEGAFTGAKKGGKPGKFELANGGSILLDEIGDMPLTMQAKLLRVLQEKEVERLGGNVIRKIDVRIISSTNKDLEALVKKGEFRQDLFYRLNVMAIKIPPLRERKEDIEALANELKMKLSNRLDIYVEGISQRAIEILKKYDWRGNVRELENVIERAINLLDSDLIIKSEHLPKRLTKNNQKIYPIENKPLKERVEEMEKELIIASLKANSGNKYQAAKALGISRVGLYKKLKRYGLEGVYTKEG